MDISDMGESSWRGFIGSTASTLVVKGGGSGGEHGVVGGWLTGPVQIASGPF